MIPQPVQIPPATFAFFDAFGRDASSNPQSLGSLTATIDNYSAAFVCKYQGHVAIVPKSTPPAGQTTVVNVTLNGTDVNANPLPALTVTANIQGPPPPPLAVSLDTANPASASASTTPAPVDPGSATATIV